MNLKSWVTREKCFLFEIKAKRSERKGLGFIEKKQKHKTDSNLLTTRAGFKMWLKTVVVFEKFIFGFATQRGWFFCVCFVFFLFCSQAVLKPFFFQRTAIKRNFSHRDKNVYQNESTKYTARKWKHESEIAQNEPGLFSCNFKGAGIREQTWAQGKKNKKKKRIFLFLFGRLPCLILLFYK